MDYRAYILNDEGHISSYVELQCCTDEEAKEHAAQLLDGHDIEVWQQARTVAILKAPKEGLLSGSKVLSGSLLRLNQMRIPTLTPDG